MKRHAKKAYDKLVKMGIVMADPSWAEGGHFAISGESDHGDWSIKGIEAGKAYLIDYYHYDVGEFGVDQKVCDILRENGLMCEWQNEGVLGIYDE